MKKLTLLMFTILILGCGNQNPVSEPNEDLAEIKVVANQLSQAAASLDLSGPIITASSITDGDTDVDPEPLNREGIRIIFSERVSLSHFNLHDKEGTSLDWRVAWYADGQTVTLTPPHLCSVLRPGMTYTIDFVVQDFSSWKTDGTITFTTKTRPGKAASAFDPTKLVIAFASIYDGDVDIAPAPLNRDGITITFSKGNIATSQFDLRPKEGPTLGWTAQWDKLITVTLTPPNQCSLLRHGTTYVMDLLVQDTGCQTLETTITFTTKD